MNFQELIFALERFWADQGCVIQQPYDTEVGAGTFHPATFLRALGPEPCPELGSGSNDFRIRVFDFRIS